MRGLRDVERGIRGGRIGGGVDGGGGRRIRKLFGHLGVGIGEIFVVKELIVTRVILGAEFVKVDIINISAVQKVRKRRVRKRARCRGWASIDAGRRHRMQLGGIEPSWGGRRRDRSVKHGIQSGVQTLNLFWAIGELR